MRTRPPAGVHSVAVHTWRRTTALRSCTLALVLGLAVGDALLVTVVPLVLAAGFVAAGACVLDLPGSGDGTERRWVPVVEGAAYACVLAAAGSGAPLLLVLLALPGVVAGTRFGARATMSAATATVLVALVAGGATPATGPQPAALVLWTAVGLGAGLLAAGQSRATRELAAAQAPLAAAHHLVVRLHDLVQDRSVELDVAGHTAAIQDETRRLARATTSSLWVRPSAAGTAAGAAGGAPALLAAGGRPEGDEDLAASSLHSGRAQRRGSSLALPLRIGERTFGALVLGGTSAAPGPVQDRVDALAVGLETALLVQAVRAGATREERGRLSRDLHDGLAQRAVVLGYLADEVVEAAEAHVAESGRPGSSRAGWDVAVCAAATRLRAEAGDLVEDLRFSVFDLRTDLLDEAGLAGSLRSYVEDLSLHSDLAVHLTVEERGPRLTRAAESEVLRIAQEAVSNVHRHAGADSLWLALHRDGAELTLLVEDDGRGEALPRPGHFGLHTMRERAELLGGRLDVGLGVRGGTRVTLTLHAARCESAPSLITAYPGSTR